MKYSIGLFILLSAACGASETPQPIIVPATATDMSRAPVEAEFSKKEPIGSHGSASESKAAEVPNATSAPAFMRLALAPFAQTTVREVDRIPAMQPVTLKRKKRGRRRAEHNKWLKKHKLALPTFHLPTETDAGNLPTEIPQRVNGMFVVLGIADGDYNIFVYGQNYNDGRLILVTDSANEAVARFDLSDWSSTPEDSTDHVNQQITWAAVRSGTLFVATGHNTYASSSKGLNAYISAVDLKSGALLWRSAPLVSNAGAFVIRGASIISGYGFTDEDDFLYIISARTGVSTSQVPLKSGPDFIVAKGNSLFVRTYSFDYEFTIK